MTPLTEAMNTIQQSETIAALATPPGVSGIAVIRVSGEKAIQFVDDVFLGHKPLQEQPSHTANVGTISDANGNAIDQVVVTVFKAPHSYTGEDSVEVSCHGGNVVSRNVLERILGLGVRHAAPGEFTRRAFLNGKLDLVQAEAVADLIHAQSHEAHRASVAQMEGRLSSYVGELRETLLHIASMLELTLDFAEEDVELLSQAELKSKLVETRQKLQAALETYSTGKIIRDGVRVVIVGKPNAGKSSLLNVLLNAKRAIVTDTPGTTRDYIEESVIVGGQLFRFIDTAGLRVTDDAVELIGIEFGKEMLKDADITCCLIDGIAEELNDDSWKRIVDEFIGAGVEKENALFVVNKTDAMKAPKPQLKNVNNTPLFISALTGEGLEELRNALVEKTHNLKHSYQSGEVLVTNIRHAECLRKSVSFLESALKAHDEQQTEEVIAFEIRQAIESLGEIIGEVVTDDILNSIFSRFCIGK